MTTLCRSAIVSAVALSAFIGFDHQGIAARLGLFQNHKDIGVTPKKGKARFDSKRNQYTVTGGGANMWLKTDAFQYVYKLVSGDITLTADVHFLGQGVEQHRKAALVIRQSLDPDSAYADVALHGDGLTSLQYRESAGATTLETRSDLKAPVEIRIERRGNQFSIAAGNPGEELKRSGPVTVEMRDPVYVGLAVCSHNAEVLETAVFSNVSLSQAERHVSDTLRLLARGDDGKDK